MNLRAYHEFHTIKRKESNITFFLLASLGGKPFLKHKKRGVPVGAQQKGTQLGSMWTQIPSLASLSGWGSRVAVAMAYRPATRAPIQPHMLQVWPLTKKVLRFWSSCIISAGQGFPRKKHWGEPGCTKVNWLSLYISRILKYKGLESPAPKINARVSKAESV